MQIESELKGCSMTKRFINPAALMLACIVIAAAAQATPLDRPRLVVLISIDQFRADYLTRFEDLFLPPVSGGKVGGFRYLMERGAYFADAHHDHLPLATGPGHSIHFTGAPPYKSGIVGNDWYDRQLKKDVYCVQDDSSPIVGSDAKMIGISPEHLRVTTVGDELKMATGGASRVFGISLKDRAAVLMAGHLADGVFWFDDNTGNWVSSRYYRKDGTLPAWVNAINAQKIPQSFFDKTWEFSAPESARKRLWTPTGKYADDRNGVGTEFPHKMSAGQSAPNKKTTQAFTTSPFANQFVLDSAKRLITEEKLGQDEASDVLAINLASNDYIGHSFGPDSTEVLDVTYQTDRQLSHFFNDLNALVPGGLANVTIIVTADHGAAPNGQAMQDSGIRGGIWTSKQAADAVQAALNAKFGTAKWVHGYIEPYLWLDHDVIAQKGIPLEQVQDEAARALTQNVKGVYAGYAGHNIAQGILPRTDIARHVSLGYNPLVSGDIAIISQPFYMPRDIATGTTHAEPYAYDTRVPLLVAGYGVRPGTYTDRVSTLDIAPTLSFLCHVQQPSGCEGHILSRALAADGPNRK
jgi:predicted AlkP superfamily pyrophosphatase or phosphodiesterase